MRARLREERSERQSKSLSLPEEPEKNIGGEKFEGFVVESQVVEVRARARARSLARTGQNILLKL